MLPMTLLTPECRLFKIRNMFVQRIMYINMHILPGMVYFFSESLTKKCKQL